MKLSKIIAILSWLNLYAFLWSILLYPHLLEYRGTITVMWLLFSIVALISSAMDQRR